MNKSTFIDLARQPNANLGFLVEEARKKLDRQALVAFFKFLKKEFIHLNRWYTVEVGSNRRGKLAWDKLGIGIIQADCQNFIESCAGYAGYPYRILSPDGDEVAAGTVAYISVENSPEMSNREVQSADRSSLWGAWRD